MVKVEGPSTHCYGFSLVLKDVIVDFLHAEKKPNIKTPRELVEIW